MATYNARSSSPKRHFPKLWLVTCAVLVIVGAAAAVAVWWVYDNNLRPLSSSQKSVLVTVPSGASLHQIATTLKKDGVIRADWAFEWYVHSQEAVDKLQAGTYALSPSQTVAQITTILTQGKISTKLVTILPGQRLDQIHDALINAGFSPTAVDRALDPAQYQGLPALVDKPTGANLEGYLYPDSFQKSAGTDPTTIIEESLAEMNDKLTPSLRAAFASENLNTYQAIILASIVEQEVSKPANQAQAAQVFIKRLGMNMPLGSDVTAFYGAVLAGQPPSVSYDSPYNTLLHTGLPPTPISNVNNQALQAVAHPASTDWLYFVAGDDGTTYFEQTLAQHQADITQYCHKLCAADSQ